jgi:hypothetical protein
MGIIDDHVVLSSIPKVQVVGLLVHHTSLGNIFYSRLLSSCLHHDKWRWNWQRVTNPS